MRGFKKLPRDESESAIGAGDAGQTGQLALGGHPTLGHKLAPGPFGAAEKSQEGPAFTPGLFPGISIADLTDTYGALAYDDLEDVSRIVTHRTMSSTAQSTLDTYDGRIKNNEGVGAHYLIDQDGAISLTVPTDKEVGHVIGYNSDSIGIEHVGMPYGFTGAQDLYSQSSAGALAFTPQQQAALDAMSESELDAFLASNQGYLYGDITGPQKRSSWLLANALADQFGLQVPQDTAAHEDLQDKTFGEGGAITDFYEAMSSYPEQVEALKQELLTRLPGAVLGDEGIEEFIELRTLLEHHQAVLEAQALDGTPAQQVGLTAEQILGVHGPATQRDELLNQFYGDFWSERQTLDAAVAPRQDPSVSEAPLGGGPRLGGLGARLFGAR